MAKRKKLNAKQVVTLDNAHRLLREVEDEINRVWYDITDTDIGDAELKIAKCLINTLDLIIVGVVEKSGGSISHA